MEKDALTGRAKRGVKGIVARLMRPALAGVNRRLDTIDSHLGLVERNAKKYREELQYWRWFIKKGGCEKQHGEPFEQVFARWQRHRLLHLAAWMGVATDESEGAIDQWCAERSVVEIGAGPYPAVAAAKRGWKRCVAVDPLARGYVEEGLLPRACDGVVYIEAPGENIPLATEFADLVIIENCLDHVSDPGEVVAEIRRLLKPGGLMWLFVDLSNHSDEMHPHAMNEEKVRGLLGGFEVVRDEVAPLKAHPQAYAGYRALYRKPAPTAAAPPETRTRLGPRVQIMTRATQNGAAAAVQKSVT